MPVELRKRKAPAPPPAPPPSRKKSTKAKTADTNNQVVKKTAEKISNNKKEANGAFKPTEKPGPPAKGDTIRLDNFGGEVETNDGKTVSLKDLVKESKSGVVLFTYPKASTPGCKLIDSLFFSLKYFDIKSWHRNKSKQIEIIYHPLIIVKNPQPQKIQADYLTGNHKN